MPDNNNRPPLQAEPEGFAFGRFVLRRRQHLLLLDGVPVELGSRAIEILLALVAADGALLTKGAIMDRVWPDVAVEENNLQVQVSALRRALGQDRDWIVTVPGRGYRFTGVVAALRDENAADMSMAGTAHPDGAAEPPSLSVLVLPFAGRGGSPAGDWFADSVTDSLTTDLARALPPGSAVIAQTTADTYKGHPADVRAIGRDQGVRYVVEGSVLLAGDQVRVNAQLVAAETGRHLWADRFDTPRFAAVQGDGLLQVQDQIVGRLARSVGLEMVGAEARRAERADCEHPEEVTAQDYVMRADAAASQGLVTRDSVESACVLYVSALDREPCNADALAGLAYSRIYQVTNGYLEAGQSVRDEAAAREAHLAEAEETLARALAAAPGHLKAMKGRAVLLRARGLFAEAIAAAEALLTQTPGDPATLREIGLNLVYLGRTEEAVAWFQRADTVAPSDPARWTWLQGLGRALMQLGRDAEAADALRLAVASNPAYAPSHAFLAAALASAGEDVAARAAMEEFRRMEPNAPLDTFARHPAVPHQATSPLYQAGNARMLDGMRRAAVIGR